MKPGLAAAAVALLLVACGPADPTSRARIAFRQHALTCDVTDLQARVQIAGVEEPCALQVSSDRLVSGLCEAVPAGDVRAFRLVYFVVRSETEVELATVVASLDLRDQTERVVELLFPADRVVTMFDEDNDQVTNLVEVCTGRNPIVAGE